jgi:hypothetical protein
LLFENKEYESQSIEEEIEKSFAYLAELGAGKASY